MISIIFMFALIAALGLVANAFAQVVDKDNGASSYAPRGSEPPTAGGWMPMERPGWDPNDAAEDNPGQSGREAGIIGCLYLKCSSK